MTVHPSIEGRELVADDRYPGYKAALEARRGEHEERMLRPSCEPRMRDYLAGAITALDFALGKPDEMKDSVPTEPATPSSP